MVSQSECQTYQILKPVDFAEMEAYFPIEYKKFADTTSKDDHMRSACAVHGGQRLHAEKGEFLKQRI